MQAHNMPGSASPTDIEVVNILRRALEAPIRYIDHRASHSVGQGTHEELAARLSIDGVETLLTGTGNGPVDAFVHALREGVGADIHVLAYHEHATGSGEDATAVAYVQLRAGSRTVYGVGLHQNIVTATLRAVIAALNRGYAQGVVALPASLDAVAA
jgi:2-isopropylmalate synthase